MPRKRASCDRRVACRGSAGACRERGTRSLHGARDSLQCPFRSGVPPPCCRAHSGEIGMNTRLRLSGRLTGAVVLVALATAGAASTRTPPADERPPLTAGGAPLRPPGVGKRGVGGAS